MSILGRRKHSRFVLAQPILGNLRLRDEVAVERLTDTEAVVVSPEPCRRHERVTLEIPGPFHRRVTAEVTECRPVVMSDGGIRHRCLLSIDEHEPALEGHRS